MTFMNKKEEVLDIKLTQYGKKLLSTGDFDPVYYTFHDEGVLYDSTYASFEESQNSIEGRILEGTPALRTQYNFTSATESGGIIKITNPDGSIAEIDIFQISQRSALGLPLGTSDLNNQNFPAFKVKVHDGEITGTDLDFTGSLGNKIPQVDCKIKATAHVRNIEDIQKYENPFGTTTSPIAANGSYLTIDMPNFLVEIVEDNVAFDSENFDIEVFLSPLEENKPLSYSTIQLSSGIVDGILLDGEMNQDENFVLPTKDDIEYYFDIIKDNDILPDVVSSANLQFKSKGFYNDPVSNSIKERTSLEISDIYSTPTRETDIEDCE